MRRKRIFLVLTFLLLVGLASFVVIGQETVSEFTTNIDLENKIIVEREDGGLFLNAANWIRDAAGEGLMAFTGSWAYQNLAGADTRYVYIREGLRREEVAALFAKQLNWDLTERDEFISAPEGTYYPGTYLLSEGKDSGLVRELMLNRYEREIEDKYATSTRNIISIPTALKIASLIERESNGKRDMRLISGIIWNRIFKDMPLQIDATLQYAKGTEETGWWPVVLPEDKDIRSPYNTYRHKGFPPTPIANPGVASVHAALNPSKTSCLFYLHDKKRKIHCSATYEGHKRNIDKYY